MPKHSYIIHAVIKFTGEIDPDDLDGFDGNPADEGEVAEFLEAILDQASSGEELQDFAEATLKFTSITTTKIDLVKEPADTTEEE